MVWQQFRSAVGWMSLVVGLMALLGGFSELDLGTRCTREAQSTTLQELLDGKAGENLHVAVTEYRLCDRFVTSKDRNQSRVNVTYIGVLPDRPRNGADPKPRRG